MAGMQKLARTWIICPMAVKIIAAILLLILLVAGLLFIDRPFVRLRAEPSTADMGPLGAAVKIHNDGPWDAYSFGFAYGVVTAFDAAGNPVVNRSAVGSFLLAESGPLTAGETREMYCGLDGEPEIDRFQKVTVSGMAFFKLRYLSRSRVRLFRISMERDQEKRFHIIEIK